MKQLKIFMADGSRSTSNFDSSEEVACHLGNNFVYSKNGETILLDVDSVRTINPPPYGDDTPKDELRAPASDIIISDIESNTQEWTVRPLLRPLLSNIPYMNRACNPKPQQEHLLGKGKQTATRVLERENIGEG